jgi:hypothetical protein
MAKSKTTTASSAGKPAKSTSSARPDAASDSTDLTPAPVVDDPTRDRPDAVGDRAPEASRPDADRSDLSGVLDDDELDEVDQVDGDQVDGGDDRVESFSAGDVVTHSWVDPYAGAGGADAQRTGVVISVEDDGRPIVAWLDDISGALDPETLTKV